MFARPLILLFATGVMFGQDAVPVKAGVPAPAIDWAKTVRSPEQATNQPSLTGQFTVLQFLPNVTANAQAIGRWNDLIAQFAGKPVQFVWIASEPWPAVQPFLKEHPMDGWLLIDEKEDTARAYGYEMGGGTAIVDPSGQIAGFSVFLQPVQLSAVLEGKAVAIPRDAEEDEVYKLLAEGKTRLESEPEHLVFPPMLAKPDIAPSYEVHISPSNSKGTVSSSGPDFWVRRGFDLRSMVAEVYKKDPGRVALPDALDNQDKFDFVVVLPREEDEEAIHQLVQRAIEESFKVSAIVETKPMEAYVMTAVKGKTPPAKTGDEAMGGGFMSFSGFEFTVPAGTANTPEAMRRAVDEQLKRPENMGISNVSASNASIEEFRQNLERGMGLPVVDETGLEGDYDLEVHGQAKSTEEFIQMLREQTGIALTKATRDIETVRLRSLN